MPQFLMIFYMLFFATGFMGGAALLLLGFRVRSRLVQPLLAFQVLFLVGIGLIVVYFQLVDIPAGPTSGVAKILLAAMMAANTALYGIAILLIRRTVEPAGRRTPLIVTAQVFAALIAARSLVNMVVIVGSPGGSAAFLAAGDGETWDLAGRLLSGLAMASFGLAIRKPLDSREAPALAPLMRAYGACALAFAPSPLVEYALQRLAIPWLDLLSLEHLFFLSWNLVSMSAAIRIFRPGVVQPPLLREIPEDRAQALGLSTREVQMALMIARGLANKEIAAELGISPATVRTHIYNLYRKAGARSRVELLNRIWEQPPHE